VSRPFTMDDHVARFRAELGRRFDATRVDALQAEVQGLAAAGGVARLMQLLSGR